MQYGLSIWPQYTSWDAQKEAGLLAERHGYDQIWTWDHFLPIVGDASGPNFECWQILAAWGALTKRVRIGALVCGITYRHPALLANMAATLDHITEGRAIMGLGAAWFEREHNQYGIHFGTAGERLAKLAEAAGIVRSLLDNPTTTHEGKHYQLRDARLEPKPVQAHLPIMIGGGGERKTLRITAQWADMWNGFGTPEVIASKLAILRKHCEDVGGNYDDITPTVMISSVVRDDPAQIDDYKRRLAETNRIPSTAGTPAVKPIDGTVEEVARGIHEFWKVGARGVILRMSPPYDLETLERVATQVRPRVQQMIDAG